MGESKRGGENYSPSSLYHPIQGRLNLLPSREKIIREYWKEEQLAMYHTVHGS
jgi:hypothetical protein